MALTDEIDGFIRRDEVMKNDSASTLSGYRKNHYIPEFYQKAWIGSDNRVCQYSRPAAKGGAQTAQMPV